MISKITLSGKKKYFPWVMLIFAVYVDAAWGMSVALSEEKSNIDVLKEKVAVVGKLDFKRDVRINYLNKTQLKKYIEAQFEADYPTALSEKENVFIRLMGYVDNDIKIDIKNTRKRILLDNIGGLYNEDTNELLVLNQYREVNYFSSMVLFHELRHAIQDQYFNVAEILDSRSASDFDDRRLAVLAALEGDATFLMMECSGMNADLIASTPTGDALMSYLPAARPSLLNQEPEIVKYQLLMPYIEGIRFVSAVFKKKKWKGVNRILSLPPASTEQILHPEKYFKREAPIEVFIQYQPQGYKLEYAGVIGEYFLNILLKSRGDYSYKDYAQGWGGDTFHIYKKSSSYFLVWESLWDKDIYCSNFFADFKRFIEKRFEVNFKKGNVNGTDFIAGRANSKQDYFFIMRLNNKIFYARSDNRDQMNALIYGGNYD